MRAIVPVFVNAKFIEHAQIIGRLLAGYGELELELCLCASAAGKEQTASERETGALREFFKIRRADRRLALAQKKGALPYRDAGLGNEFDTTIEAMDYCRTIRNQYAHCHWYGDDGGDLGFTNLEAIVNIANMWPLSQHIQRLDLNALQQQESFFKHVQRCLWDLRYQYDHRVHGAVAPAWPAGVYQFRGHRCINDK